MNVTVNMYGIDMWIGVLEEELSPYHRHGTRRGESRKRSWMCQKEPEIVGRLLRLVEVASGCMILLMDI